MAGAVFDAREFNVSGEAGSVCLIGQFGGEPHALDAPAEVFARLGYHVVGYTYGAEVLLNQSAEILPATIDGIGEDFEHRRHYERVRFAGLSLGGFIGMNLQEESRGEVLPGVFSAMVPNPIKLAENPDFCRYADAMLRRYELSTRSFADPEVRANNWSGLYMLETVPRVGFANNIGLADKVVPPEHALVAFDNCVALGGKIAVLSSGGGHSSVMNRFPERIPELLLAADELEVVGVGAGTKT